MRYITTYEDLEKAALEWSELDVIAVDLECENNLHHYGAYVSLIQLSSRDQDWIIDILELDDITPLKEMLERENMVHIFHDADFDFRILFHEFGIRPQGLFDTQLGALFLGHEKIGLGDLLMHYFEVEKVKKFQMADWTKRPLRQDMLDYAMGDTQHLIQLHEQMVQELAKLGRLDWVIEECNWICDKGLEYNEGGMWSFKGIGRMSDSERGILKELWELRDKLARKADRPIHYIISNKKLREIIERPPKNIRAWDAMKAVHPMVRRYAREFYDAVMRGKKHPISMPERERRKKKVYEKDHTDALMLLREKVSKREGIAGHLILSKEQIRHIVIEQNATCMRDWQHAILLAEDERYYSYEG